MDTNYIHEFLILREEGSFLKAASTLGITQSTLSRHIQAIEAEVGGQLINRSSHAFQFTAAGNAFTAYALTVAEAQKVFVADMENKSVFGDTCLNIGVAYGSSNYGVLELLKAFHEEEPSISINTHNDLSDGLLHDLQHGLSDVIFGWSLGAPGLGYGGAVFAEDRFVLHIPWGHRLYEQDVVHISELHGEEVYVRGKPYSRTFNIIKQKCLDTGEELNLCRQPGYWMSASDGILYMTLSKRVDHIRHNGAFHIARIEPNISQALDIRYKINGLSDAALKLLDFASSYMRA